MPKHTKYKLKQYLNACELLSVHVGKIEYNANGGSKYSFRLFEKGSTIPCAVWAIHHEHDKNKTVWSKRDIQKAADSLRVSYEDFTNAMDKF